MTPTSCIGAQADSIGPRSKPAVLDLGTPLAALAVWALAALTPLHQTSGLLRELTRRGFSPPAEVWSICMTISEEEEGGSKLASHACGVSGPDRRPPAQKRPPEPKAKWLKRRRTKLSGFAPRRARRSGPFGAQLPR